MQDGGLFSGEAGNVYRWLTTAGVVLVVAAILGSAVGLARHRAGPLTPGIRWLFLGSLLVIPAVAMLLGNVVGFHSIPQSCGDCHVMQPWIDDMKDPKSATLAAKHYRNRWINENQCYTCHTGYGMAGNVDAKISGVSHVLHYYFTGVTEEIRIRKPFPAATCLHCHGAAAGYLEVAQHMDDEYRADIQSGKLSCFECHEAPHPRSKP